ncbi:MAG: DUF1580 domain-containing protein [Planctomycetes bacterium]|nr:DUF1580 domain-containing protein [Planctomycetota bacterium]
MPAKPTTAFSPLPPIYQAIVDASPECPEPVTKVAGRFGWKLHDKSAIRLCNHGSHGVRLPTIKVGGRRMTTARAFAWFLVEREAAAKRTKAAAGPVDLLLDAGAADKVLASRGLGRTGARLARSREGES